MCEQLSTAAGVCERFYVYRWECVNSYYNGQAKARHTHRRNLKGSIVYHKDGIYF